MPIEALFPIAKNWNQCIVPEQLSDEVNSDRHVPWNGTHQSKGMNDGYT